MIQNNDRCRRQRRAGAESSNIYNLFAKHSRHATQSKKRAAEGESNSNRSDSVSLDEERYHNL